MAIAALTLVSIAVLLPRVLLGPLRHWDEAWYAETSREIIQSGDWLTLQWNEEPWFHKPPLSFWATAGVYQLLGVSEFSARLFSAVSGLATVLLMGGFVARQLRPSMGFICGCLLLAIPEFCRFATRGQVDAPVTLWISIQLVCFWLGLTRPRLQLLGGVAFGLGLMTKGAAAGLAGVVEIAYLLAARDPRPLRQWQWWAAPVVGLAIAAPWHVQQSIQHRDAFTEVYFSRHLTQFFSDIYPEVDHEAAPASYYLDFWIRKETPVGWAILATLIMGVVAAVRRPRDRFLIFALCWAAAIPVALSFSWAKWHWYLVPAYPGIAILATLLIDTLFSKCRVTLSAKSDKGEDRRAIDATSPLSKILFPHSPPLLLPPLTTRWLVLSALILAAATSLEPLWVHGRELEEELRTIGPRIRDTLPPGSRWIALQIDTDARRSIFPVTPRFYSERNVTTVHSVAELERLAERAGNVVFALAHRDVVGEIDSRGRRMNSTSDGYDVEILDSEGPVDFLRLTPGWLGDEIRQAARNKAASR